MVIKIRLLLPAANGNRYASFDQFPWAFLSATPHEEDTKGTKKGEKHTKEKKQVSRFYEAGFDLFFIFSFSSS
jgi:hypothetical protein